MDDMLLSLRRGWDAALRAALPLLVGGLVWTGLNLLTAGLLIGPALVGLFHVALKSLEGRRPEIPENFVAFDDVAAPLLAGLVFLLPFRLGQALSGELGGLLVGLLLLAWFAIGVFVFAVLADRPGLRLAEAVRRAWELADRPAAPERRVSGLARHLLFGAAVALALGLLRAIPVLGLVSLVVTLPLAICLLAAWYGRQAFPSQAVSTAGAVASGPQLAGPKASSRPRREKARTPAARGKTRAKGTAAKRKDPGAAAGDEGGET